MILYIGNKLSSHGNTTTLIETLGENLESENYKVLYTSSKKNKVVRMLDMVLKTFIHARKSDYVLIDTYSTTNFWYAFVTSQICRLFSTKYIPILHGGKLPSRIEKSRITSKMIFSNSYINVAPSGYLLEVFKKKNFKTIYIPNSIQESEYKFEVRNFDYPRLFWLRSFSKIYNPILATKVLLKLKEKYPEATLCMVGPKKDESFEITKNFAHQNNLKVKFTGMLSKEDWIELSKDYNVFLNTTHYDNTPLSVIEAMALGFPIVSTNVGGIPFLLEHNFNALLVNDNDLETMILEIDRIFTEKMLPEKLISNSQNTIEKFDWKIVKNQWIELLK